MKKNNPNKQNGNNHSVPYGQPYRADPSWQKRQQEREQKAAAMAAQNQQYQYPASNQPVQRQPQQGRQQPNIQPHQGALQQPNIQQPNPNQIYSNQPQVYNPNPAANYRGPGANQQMAYAANGRGNGQPYYAAANRSGNGQPYYAAANRGGNGQPPYGGYPGQPGQPGQPGTPIGPNGKPPRKKRKKKALWITLAVITVLLIIIGSIYGYYINRYNKEIMVDQSYVDDWEDVDGSGNQIIRVPRKDKNVENYLLLGVDGGDMNEGSLRSDSMMVVSINSKEKTIRIASLMRDIWAYYPDKDGYDKLNAAHARGGPAQAINIINHNFDLDIQKFVVTDFNGLQNLVDVLGGIEMEISTAEAGQISGIDSGGTVTLNGKQALQYARIRKIDSDFSRVERQRNVIMAMLSKMKSEDLQTQINTINESMQYVQANIPAHNITGDLLTLVLSSSSGIEQMTVPEDGMYTVNSSGTWYMELDWDQQVPSLHDFLYGKRSTGSND